MQDTCTTRGLLLNRYFTSTKVVHDPIITSRGRYIETKGPHYNLTIKPIADRG